MLVLALVVVFAGILAILAYALDRASRSVLVETWKSESGHRLVAAAQERFVAALSELGEDLREIPKTGPSNSLAHALFSVRKGQTVEAVVPTTSPPELEPSPYQVGEVRARFQLVTGSLEEAVRGWPWSQSRFRVATSTAATETTSPAHLPPASVRRTMDATAPIQPVADEDGPVCHGPPGTTGKHTCSLAVVAMTLEATATVEAGRQRARRTISETRLLHVTAHHVPEMRGKVVWDVPYSMNTDLSVFYTMRRIREEGAE
jgi:hypothetical protein